MRNLDNMIIKVISLTQPWASLCVIGAKRIETRSWPTSHRGPIGIHAAKKFPKECQALCFEEPFKSVLKAAGYWPTSLPRGQILGVGYLDDCQATGWLTSGGFIDEQERAFGDYSPGRYGFLLSRVVALPKPIECNGALMLWNWHTSPEARELLEARPS